MNLLTWYLDATKVWLQSVGRCVWMAWDYRRDLNEKMNSTRRLEVRKEERDVRGRVIIVTGCNSGIGKETAMQLAKREAIVIMACRNLLRAENARQEILSQLPGAKVVCMQLNLGDMTSIRQFVSRFKESYARLDVLVNNAGVFSRKRSYTEDGFESHMGVNYLGHFLLTLLLLDSILKADDGRIVFLSSTSLMTADLRIDDWMMRAQPQVPGTAYANSKLALAMFSQQLSKLLAGTNVTTYSVCTGVVADTNLLRSDEPLKRLLSSALNPMKALSVEEGVENVLHCVLSQSLSKESGKFYRFLCVWDAPDKIMCGLSAEKLWELSEDAVGLSEYLKTFKAQKPMP